MAHHAYIGLGANLRSPAGAPEQTLRAALRELAGAGRVAACSSLYQTEPVGTEHQPPFVNAVAEIETEMDAEALLDFLLGVERRYGRERGDDLSQPKGPRSLDLDLLLMDDLVLDTPRLSLPHPALTERRFVLEPLAEIAPDLRIPDASESGRTVAQWLAALPDSGPNRRDGVRRLP